MSPHSSFSITRPSSTSYVTTLSLSLSYQLPLIPPKTFPAPTLHLATLFLLLICFLPFFYHQLRPLIHFQSLWLLFFPSTMPFLIHSSYYALTIIYYILFLFIFLSLHNFIYPSTMCLRSLTYFSAIPYLSSSTILPSLSCFFFSPRFIYSLPNTIFSILLLAALLLLSCYCSYLLFLKVSLKNMRIPWKGVKCKHISFCNRVTNFKKNVSKFGVYNRS